jgi:hypothetical protein
MNHIPENLSLHRVAFISCVQGLMFAFVPSAFAGIIYFENPPPGQEGHFNWHWQMRFEEETFENWLDITKSPMEQSDIGGTNSVGQLCLGCDITSDYNWTSGGAAVATFQDGAIHATMALDFGDPVQTNQFETLSAHVYDFEKRHSDFEVGVLSYIGVLTGSGNYGWILVERIGESHFDLYNLVAYAWAYETIPGKPINAGDIPAPGGAAAFALLALGTRRRRAASTCLTQDRLHSVRADQRDSVAACSMTGYY